MFPNRKNTTFCFILSLKYVLFLLRTWKLRRVKATSFVPDYESTSSGCWAECFKPLLLCLACLLTPPFFILGILLYPCCSFKGRRKFLRLLKSCYLCCCCRIDFVSKLSLTEAITRYVEEPPMGPEV